jgi:hypothetical protein
LICLRSQEQQTACISADVALDVQKTLTLSRSACIATLLAKTPQLAIAWFAKFACLMMLRTVGLQQQQQQCVRPGTGSAAIVQHLQAVSHIYHPF